MTNMSYWRFEATSTALQDCYDNMPDSINDLPTDDERQGYMRLVKLCKLIAEETKGTS